MGAIMIDIDEIDIEYFGRICRIDEGEPGQERDVVLVGNDCEPFVFVCDLGDQPHRRRRVSPQMLTYTGRRAVLAVWCADAEGTMYETTIPGARRFVDVVWREEDKQ